MARRIQSIPTPYNGTTFRSKLEADWVRFLDDRGVKWAYESEGFDIEGTWYLPDLWLPELRTFVEIKGILDTTSEQKVRALAGAVRDQGIIVVLAEAPVGERWALVTENGPLTYFYGLETCPCCHARQFMVDEECRVCANASERPAHGPPYSEEEWSQIFKWWAVELERHDRHEAAEELRRHVEDAY